jgi:hypothetical protein
MEAPFSTSDSAPPQLGWHPADELSRLSGIRKVRTLLGRWETAPRPRLGQWLLGRRETAPRPRMGRRLLGRQGSARRAHLALLLIVWEPVRRPSLKQELLL